MKSAEGPRGDTHGEGGRASPGDGGERVAVAARGERERIDRRGSSAKSLAVDLRPGKPRTVASSSQHGHCVEEKGAGGTLPDR